MAYGPTRIGRIALKEQSGWGTAASSFAAADVAEIVLGDLPSTPQEEIRPDIMLASYYQAPGQAGSKAIDGNTHSFEMPLHGVDASTPTADVSEHLDAMLLRLALGASSQDGYHASAQNDGGTTTTVVVTTGNGEEAHAGHAILVPISGGHSWGWITEHSSDTYTVTTLAGTPSGSGDILGSNTVYLTVGGLTNGLTFQWLGADSSFATRKWDGALTSLTLDLSPGQQPTASFDVRFNDWTNDATGGAPSAAAHSFPQLPIASGTHGARYVEAGTAIKVSSVSLSIEQTTENVPDHAANQGRSQQVDTNRVITLEVTRPVTSLSTIRTVGSNVEDIQIDTSTTPGKAMSVWIGTAQVLSNETITAAGELVGLTTRYGVDLYTGDTETTLPAGSNMRIAFG